MELNPKNQIKEAQYFRIIEDATSCITGEYELIELTAHIAYQRDSLELAISSSNTDLRDLNTVKRQVTNWLLGEVVPQLSDRFPNTKVRCLIFTHQILISL